MYWSTVATKGMEIWSQDESVYLVILPYFAIIEQLQIPFLLEPGWARMRLEVAFQQPRPASGKSGVVLRW